MNIGILGSGEVAQSLAAGFLARGHAVKLGTRDDGKLADWKAGAGDRASVGSFADAARFGELVVLATLGTATVDIVTAAGAEAFAGKTVIDATNPLRYDRGAPELAFGGFDDSLGERVQSALPNAHVVKAFNTVGASLMVDPKLRNGPPLMFLAGNDAGAKKVAAEIVRSFGWDVDDLGGIEQSRLLEALCMVWVRHGLVRGTWEHAFAFLTPV